MSTAKVTLGGLDVAGDDNYTWTLADGTTPVEEFWTVSAEQAHEFPAANLPITLRIEGPRSTLEVKHVYILEHLAASNPNQILLRLADRRWKWAYVQIGSVLNVRRTTGQTIGLRGEGQPIELVQFDPEIAYAKASLYPPDNGNTPWTVRNALEMVFRKLDQPYRFEGQPPNTVLPPETDLDCNGPTAIERIFALSGAGMAVSIDKDGVAVVRVQVGQGKAVIPTLRKQVVGADMILSDRKAIRPRKIVVEFDREQEIRFDYNEGGTQARDTPVLTNVAASPDQTTEIEGRQVPRGSYVGLQYLFSAWGSFPFLLNANAFYESAFPGTELSFPGLAKTRFSFDVLEMMVSNAAVFYPAAARRLQATLSHWRTAFQIDERFMSRFSAVRAHRVRVLNPVTGTRARSDVYCSYTRIPNHLNPDAYKSADDEPLAERYEFDGGLLADHYSAPVSVRVEDPQAGILFLAPIADPFQAFGSTVLGVVAGDGTKAGDLPTHDAGRANRERNDAYAQWEAAQLEPSFFMSTVLTASIASPNDSRRFHAVEIDANILKSVGEADGPPLHLRVPGSVVTARFAWEDGQADAIIAAIKQGAPPPNGLLVNSEMVLEVALATAKAAYASFEDVPVTSSGPVIVDMDPSRGPSGAIVEVRHGLRSPGVTVSEITSAGVPRPIDITPFLSSWAREQILRTPRS